jgi:hypothetical protein
VGILALGRHVAMAVDALKAGKDVYLEKSVTHTLEEGAVLTRVVRSSKQTLQCGMQQRSWTHFRDAVDLIQAAVWGGLCKRELTSGKTTKETGRRNPSIRKHLIGRCGSAPHPISHTAKENYFIGVGSGILVAAL